MSRTPASIAAWISPTASGRDTSLNANGAVPNPIAPMSRTPMNNAPSDEYGPEHHRDRDSVGEVLSQPDLAVGVADDVDADAVVGVVEHVAPVAVVGRGLGVHGVVQSLRRGQHAATRDRAVPGDVLGDRTPGDALGADPRAEAGLARTLM